ncbi:MAG TPA: universal stress protein [Bryobacteraceae bacterium]|nr:universal stress protein [Bryobacteraceae bacterium]
MKKFSKILAPIAFSARCEGAVQYAEALACHFQSELTLLHVVMPLQTYGFPDALAVAPELMDDTIAAGKSQLAAFLAEGLKGINVKRETLEGEPAQTIVDYANTGKFDLIVMPTHGYGPFRRFLLGSVTAKVLHDAHCPVWTGPHLESAPAYPSISFGKVLCAVDLGPASRTVLEWGANFAREYGSAFAVVNVIPSSTVSLGGIYFDPEWSTQLKAQARDRIAFMLEEMGVKAEISVQAGDAPAMVRAVAEEMASDVLVIGRGGHVGVMGRLRANAYAILRESPCPVAAI